MSKSVFNPGSIDKIVEKIKNDKTGRMSRVMQDLLELSEKAGKVGFDLQELSIIATTGWYLSQNPELRQFFDQLISMPPPKEDDDIWN